MTEKSLLSRPMALVFFDWH